MANNGETLTTLQDIVKAMQDGHRPERNPLPEVHADAVRLQNTARGIVEEPAVEVEKPRRGFGDRILGESDIPVGLAP